ncbi:MAG: polysaccharide biosynthesis C-terminal domain-containing protein [Bacteroidota bacterium]
MGNIKKLAGQTIWYGVPTIASRFLGYILMIFLYRWYGPKTTASITQVYAAIPFLNILFTYGLETSYFRFSQNKDKSQLYNTLNISLIVSTLIFSVILLFNTDALASALDMPNKPEYFRWMVYILFLDTIATLPFAKLRQEGRPRKFAMIKVLNVLITVALVFYWLRICPGIYAENPDSIFLVGYNTTTGIGYFIIANVVASGITLLMLWKEWKGFSFKFNGKLWAEVLKYSYPLIIVGLGGMINELMSRLVYTKVLDLPFGEEQRQLGIFGANYKLAVLITMFIQVFKMAAEPFFFNQSTDKNAPRTYARVTKFFVIACTLMWLGIVLNLDWITKLAYGKNFKEYSEGAHIIPILAMGSVFLGIYYNLSVWYKLTNRTLTGAWITIAGAVITLVLNIWWIPIFKYTGSAWATFICYAFMMVISYVLGQKHYRIPYAWKKLLAYIVISVLIFLLHRWVSGLILQPLISFLLGLVLIGAYSLFILRVEKKEFQKMPGIGRFLK